MTYKPFDQKLFEENDAIAKERVASFLSNNGYTVEEGTKYGIDLVVSKEGIKPFMLEVEVKHNWSGPRFPFSTVHFLYRKKKFFEQDVKQFFALLNSEKTHAIIVDNKTILAGKIVSKPTKFTSYEKFYEINFSNEITVVKLI